jgi:hypothetical protein
VISFFIQYLNRLEINYFLQGIDWGGTGSL